MSYETFQNTTKKLKSLVEHNNEIAQQQLDARRNGIACDRCGAEMLDTDWVLGSLRNIYCSNTNCDYKTQRLFSRGY